MRKELLLGALDRSITRIAHAQFLRLSDKMEPIEWSGKVCQSLDSLAKLRQGIPPDYNDPWIALFYLTWYQAGQIQLAHSLIEEQKRARNANSLLIGDSQSLHVIDFGCGALAMKFAVAWAAADALEKGDRISSINVDSYDENPQMVRLGNSLWEQFKTEIKDAPSLSQLFKAINMIKGQHGRPNYTFAVDRPSTEVWLSAIHVVYYNNTEQVNTGLANLSRVSNPDIVFLSGHDHSQQRPLLQRASPFTSPQYNRRARTVSPEFSDGLPRITDWRRRLNSQMTPSHSFLNRNVTWGFPNALAWIYTKSS